MNYAIVVIGGDGSEGQKVKRGYAGETGRVALPKKPKRRRRFRAGVCRLCGCTEMNACECLFGTCGWVNKSRTLCTFCVEDGKHLSARTS